MKSIQYQLSLSFEQVLNLVKQLPEAEKVKLSQELSQELLDSKLTGLLEACKTDEVSLEAIAEEVEAVRTETHARQSAH
ncbi:MAG: hypothetical protein HC910_22515 [Spirulinaceae cyanobacterium SM2_1_0]|nr:hypothetical protein [Spirulinaceae cyanobacterium SM2_1_0]